MIFSNNTLEGRAKMMTVGKAKGMALLDRYFKSINPFLKMYLVDTKEDWSKIQEEMPSIVTCRVGTRIGDKVIDVRGQTFAKENVPKYIEEMKKETLDEQGRPISEVYTIITETQKKSGERIYTDGGFNIAFDLENDKDMVTIEWVGKGFDSVELTQNKVVHEAWRNTKLKDIIMEGKFLRDMSTYSKISQLAYEKSIDARIEFLLESARKYPENTMYTESKIQQYVPKVYKPMSISTMDSIINDIITPVYKQELSMKMNGLRNFTIQGNIVEGRIIPFEIATIDRMQQKEEKGNR